MPALCIRAFLRALLLLVAAASMAQASGTESRHAREFSVIGYFASWTAYGDGTEIADIDASRLTHILYAFGAVTAEGKAELGDPCADIGLCDSGSEEGGNFAALEALKARHPHLQVLISLGGWNGSAHFSRIASSEQGRQRFVRSTLRVFLEAYPDLFDGVDIDWEYPVDGGLPDNGRSPEDRANFTLLMQEFREQLDKLGQFNNRRYGLMAALSANVAITGNVELKRMTGLVDTLNIMTYDYHVGSPYTHFNAPLYPVRDDPTPLATVDASITSLRLAGVPASKIVMGIPLYARAYGGVNTTNDGFLRPADAAAAPDWAADGLDLRTLGQMELEAKGFTRHWSEEAKVPFLFNRNEGIWISHEDEQSLAAKAAYAREHSLAGVMIWHLGGASERSLAIFDDVAAGENQPKQ